MCPLGTLLKWPGVQHKDREQLVVEFCHSGFCCGARRCRRLFTVLQRHAAYEASPRGYYRAPAHGDSSQRKGAERRLWLQLAIIHSLPASQCSKLHVLGYVSEGPLSKAKPMPLVSSTRI